MKKGIRLAAVAAGVLGAGILGAGQAGARNLANAEKLYKKVCRSFHGPTAKGMASFPKFLLDDQK